MSEAEPGVVYEESEPSQESVEPTSTSGSWRAMLPDDIRDHPDITRHENIGSLVKEYANAQALIGRKGVIQPKEGDVEDHARYRSEMGIPETAAEYDLGEWAPPEGLAWDANLQNGMLEAMHEADLTPAQVQKVLSAYGSQTEATMGGIQEQIDSANRAGESDLRREYGHAYEAKLNLASRAISQFVNGDADAFLQTRLADGSAIGNNPNFIRMMVNVSENLGEDVIESDATLNAAASHTPSSAQAEIQRLMADPEFSDAYLDGHHPGHKEANDQMARLYSLASPARANR